jgi:isoleucyl-tRNA synthetase
MDEPKKSTGKTLKQTALEAMEKVSFYPATGRNRLKAMIENRPDWCISRQRDWGVPIAFLREKESGEALLDERALEIAIELFEKEGADAWYERPVVDFLPYSMKTQADKYEKVTDILDVWFDSGSTFFSVLLSGEYDAGECPADIYLEGSDQHRGWFQSSLLLSCAIRDAAPYKSVVTHGFTVDQSGQKMSKSKGNVVAPEKVLKEHGSEILRLWVAMSDFSDDVKISEEILKQNGELYRKLRNTFRFLLANINDLESICEEHEFGTLELWILSEASKVFAEVKGEFESFEYAKGMSKLNGFVVGKLSNIYLDITKDRLYCDKSDGVNRRSAQSAMALIARSLLTLVAPILTYTCDEIVDNLPAVLKGDKKSIFEFEHVELGEFTTQFDEEFFVEVRAKFSEIVDEMKKAGEIKSTLELSIATKSTKISQLNQKDLTDWFLVSEVISGDFDNRSFEVANERFFVTKSAKHKCPRCWKLASVAEDSLCTRCAEVLA